jgi:hypothetical protein
MNPGAEEIGGGMDLDYPRAGAPEFLGDCLRQGIVPGDDDFAMHDLARVTGNGFCVRHNCSNLCWLLRSLVRSHSHDYRPQCR